MGAITPFKIDMCKKCPQRYGCPLYGMVDFIKKRIDSLDRFCGDLRIFRLEEGCGHKISYQYIGSELSLSLCIEFKLNGLHNFIKLKSYTALPPYSELVTHNNSVPINFTIDDAVRIAILIYGGWANRNIGKYEFKHGYECARIMIDRRIDWAKMFYPEVIRILKEDGYVLDGSGDKRNN